jgi:hypothetical protein
MASDGDFPFTRALMENARNCRIWRMLPGVRMGQIQSARWSYFEEETQPEAERFKRDARTDEKELETMETKEIARPKDDPVMAIA